MVASNQAIASSIYTKFSKAPILEMVQFMIDARVDAQVLNELKLIDSKHHKNQFVKSYAKRIYDSYERICRILVTYPSLEFKSHQLRIKKNKKTQFLKEFVGSKTTMRMHELGNILDVVNISLTNSIESNRCIQNQLRVISKNPDWIDRLCMFVKEASGEDYSDYIKDEMVKHL